MFFYVNNVILQHEEYNSLKQTSQDEIKIFLLSIDHQNSGKGYLDNNVVVITLD
jgi:hypothetical protein